VTVDVAPLSAAKAEALRLIESEVGVLTNRVRRASVDHAKAIHPDLHAGSYAVLTFLVDQGGARAADMVARFGLDKGAVSRHLSHLEGLGLVVRSSDPADARAQNVEPTDAAMRAVATLRRHRRSVFAGKLSSWSEQELRDLAGQLTRYNAAVGNP